jgi:hypothetical protein
MSVDISVNITEDVVDIIATPTVNIVNVTNSASINPGLYDLSQFTNTSINPFVRTSGLSAYVPTSRTLTINGVTQDLSANRTFTVSAGITIGTTAITSGTVGRVLFEGSGNVVQESGNLFFDSAKQSLGLGTSDVATPLGATRGLVINGGSVSDVQLRLQSTATGNGQASGGLLSIATSGMFLWNYSNAPLFIGTNNAERMRISSTGNLLINTTTDAGYKLDVNGTARVQTSAYFATTSGSVGIGTSSPAQKLVVSNPSGGATTTFTNTTDADLQILLTSGVSLISPTTNTLAFGTTTTERMRLTSAGTLLVGATSNNTSSDISTTAQLIATRGTIKYPLTLSTAGTPISGDQIRMSFNYGSGFSATAYMGSLVENASTAATSLIFGTFASSLAEKMRLTSAGNLLINTTTDAGFRLDVQGTVRIADNLNFNNVSSVQALGTTATDARMIIRGGQGGAVGSIPLISLTTNNNITSTSGNPILVNIARDFAPTSGTATYTLASINPTINQTGGANGITRGLYINPTLTSAFDFRAIETTAGNVIFNGGNVGIGTSSPNYILTGLYSTSGQNGIRLNGSNASAQTQVLLENNLSTGLILGVTGSSIGAYGATIANQGFIYSASAITLMSDGSIIKFASGGNTERMRLATTGNVLINTTTDAGFKLDVNGTARVTGALTVGGTQLFFNGAFYNTINDRNHFGGAVSISTFLRVGTNANTVASAILQADSTTKGFLPPRMTTTEKNAIATPATGLQIYDSTLNRPCFYDGTSWITL